MEDNTRVHKGICNATRKNLGMTSLSHPPNSPDLNPIEHVWMMIKYRLAKDYAHVTSANELKHVIMQLWEECSHDEFNHLVESMPRRIQAVIKAKGGLIKY
jgi:transposase